MPKTLSILASSEAHAAYKVGVAVFDTRSSEMLIICRGFRIERNASLPRRGDGGEILSPSIALDSDRKWVLSLWP